MALPCGLAMAFTLARGAWMLLGASIGVALAMVAAGYSPLDAAQSGWAVALAAGLACEVLRRTPFDSRLDRARDTGWLVLGATAGTLPAAVAAGGQVAHSGDAAMLLVWAGAWLVLALGSLLGAVVTMTFGRRPAPDRMGQHQDTGTALACGVGLIALLIFWAASGSSQTARVTVAYVVPWLIAGIALQGHLGVASVTILLMSLLAASLADVARWPWGGVGSSRVGLAAWLGVTLVGMLVAHATAALWQRRVHRWEWALDGSRLGVADWSLQTPADSFASTAWRSLTGFSAKRWSPLQWREQVHPDDEPALEQALESLAAGHSGSQRLELRLTHSADWRWFHATLMVSERDRQDRPTRLMATLADIQERHEAQERQLMSLSLFQNLHEGLLVADADLRVLDTNPAYTQILGIPREDLLGRVPSLLQPDPADPVARQQRAAMWASLRDHGNWHGELFERRRNGQMRTLQTTVSTVRGPSQDLRYHVVVIADITEQHMQRQQLERQAHFDELTRLPNRTRLSRLLDNAMRSADREGHLLVVCYLDLDHFKPVNDAHGHAVGDRLLVELAARLRSALRSREHWADSAARLGGDEFVLLLRATTIDEARMAAERVLRVVAQPYAVVEGGATVQVSASMGATIYPIDQSDADTLLRHADHAMYGAKQAGRNGYLFFDPEQRRRTEERVSAIGRVQEALEQQEFLLYYQPKVDMRSARVLGFEALLRWDHPERGMIPPLQFLPMIEHTSLSSRVGDWVLEQALAHLAQWRQAGLDISVSVNVSARHLQEPHFALRLSELLARYDIEPLAPYLELEMLESAAHADIEVTSALLSRCRAMGIRFALDDFGTGYSTLTYLKRLPVDVLKIDRSFVHHMLDDAHDSAIVEGVIGLARTFGCTAVAEGVENPEQAQALMDLGCHIGQGTGIAAPMPSDQVGRWMREYRGLFAVAVAPGAVAAATPAMADAALGGNQAAAAVTPPSLHAQP
jgi:diguanylate cyclase (GGDEF)-like protein/PAS domain S-box-containing protein